MNNLIIFYYGAMIVKTIPYSVLTKKAHAYNRPYSSEKGRDAKSLRVMIHRDSILGCNVSDSVIQFKYDFSQKVANISIDWTQIKIEKDCNEASFTVTVQAEYGFRQTFNILIKKPSNYVKILRDPNAISRNKQHIGDLKIYSLKERQDDIYISKIHVVEISKQYGLSIDWEKNEDIEVSELADKYVINASILKDQTIKLSYDFGKSDRTVDTPVEINCKINGAPAGKEIIVHPFQPKISGKIDLITKELNLSPEKKKIGIIELYTDSLSGGKEVPYRISSNFPNLIEADLSEGDVTPEKGARISLYLVGSELKQLPKESIIVEIKNNDELIDSIVLSSASTSEGKNNTISLNATKVAKIEDGVEKYTFYCGEQDGSLPLKIKAVGSSDHIEIVSQSPHVSVNSDCITLEKGQVKEILLKVDTANTFQNEDLLIRISAPYHKDEIYKSKLQVKPLRQVKPIFSFDGKLSDNEIVVYRGNESSLLGKVTIKCSALKDEENIDKKRYEKICLSNFIINQEGTNCIRFEQVEGKNDISIGDSASFNIITDQLPINMDEVNVYFSLKDFDSKKRKFKIKNKTTQNIPDISFEGEHKLIYPVNKGLIKVGVCKIKKSGINTDKQVERTDASLSFPNDSYFCFSENKKVLEITSIDKCEVYFDVCSHFNNIDNIKDPSVQIGVPLLYSDNIDQSPVNVLNNEGITIYQYPAEPILNIILHQKSDEKVVFDNNSMATMQIQDIKYTQFLKEQGKKYLFSIYIENEQIIEFPEKKLSIKYATPDRNYIQLEHIFPFDISNNSKREEIKAYIDWKQFDADNYDGFNIAIGIDDKEMTIHFDCTIEEKITSEWYSLDLGTSAIVMAKMSNGTISTIPLRDTPNSRGALEEHPCIISSILALVNNDKENVHDIILAPERKIFNSAIAILPPLKFLVGQDRLPFCSMYAARGIKQIQNQFLGRTSLSSINPSELVKSIYQEIMTRMEDEEKEKARKLILTYPSTYTLEQIDKLQELILSHFDKITKKNLIFVAESDAVLAHYLDTMRIRVGGRKLKNGERILIYDMGAGTLDVSYVRINQCNADSIIHAVIEKRIGIPIAGNYLDYCIYQSILPYLSVEEKKNEEELKHKIQSLKPNICNDNTTITNISFDTSKNLGKKVDYKFIVESTEVQLFIKQCTEELFKLLLGDNWLNEIDTFVYSGRGCLFQPLAAYIKEHTSEKWTIERISESSDEMKLCAAKGAIKYIQNYAGTTKQPYKIVSFHQYESFAIVYLSYDEDDMPVYKCAILKSATDYKNKISETNEEYSIEIGNIDIRPEGRLIIVQSYLSAERIAKTYNNREQGLQDDDGSFISEILSVRREDLGIDDTDLAHATVKFSINPYDNTINCRIQDQSLREFQYSESIENNPYYKKGMWPFNKEH